VDAEAVVVVRSPRSASWWKSRSREPLTTSSRRRQQHADRHEPGMGQGLPRLESVRRIPVRRSLDQLRATTILDGRSHREMARVGLLLRPTPGSMPESTTASRSPDRRSGWYRLLERPRRKLDGGVRALDPVSVAEHPHHHRPAVTRSSTSSPERPVLESWPRSLEAGLNTTR